MKPRKAFAYGAAFYATFGYMASAITLDITSVGKKSILLPRCDSLNWWGHVSNEPFN